VPQKFSIFQEFDSGIRFALESWHGGLSQVTPGRGQSATSRPRGRPSLVAAFAPQITLWLRENPYVSGAEILRRVRLADYHGGKSALYELVKRLRTSRAVLRVKTTASSSDLQTEQ
jgi:hypothetical protein